MSFNIFFIFYHVYEYFTGMNVHHMPGAHEGQMSPCNWSMASPELP